jgi:hypothetical protein
MRLVAKPAAFLLRQICGNSPRDSLPAALSPRACLHRLRVCTAELLGLMAHQFGNLHNVHTRVGKTRPKRVTQVMKG